MRCSLEYVHNVGEETWLTARTDNHVSNNDFATRGDHTRKVRTRKPPGGGQGHAHLMQSSPRPVCRNEASHIDWLA